MANIPEVEVLSRDEMIIRAVTMCYQLRAEMDKANECIKQLQGRIIGLEADRDTFAEATLAGIEDLRKRIPRVHPNTPI
jgi:uncharacterized protein (UPF0210 family)